MNVNFRTFGSVLVGFSIILLFILGFVKIDVDEQGKVLCEKFHENNIPMDQCPAHNSNVSWMIMSAFAIGFVMLAFGVYMIFVAEPFGQNIKMKREFKEVDTSQCDEEERKVYEILKSKGGSGFQGDLLKETDFSKVKVTRILDRLEMKDILERKRRGMTNIIVLK
ncbi:hypothetical protein HZB03_04375 [Candidatus Woesearchaeota archaeon]|nr:hypothetical protein [Candidatus Woesearchaeota archaeon]